MTSGYFMGSKNLWGKIKLAVVHPGRNSNLGDKVAHLQ